MDLFNNVQLAATDGLVVAASLTDKIGDLTADANNLIKGILVVAGLIIAILIIAKNPSVGRVITGCLVGAFVAGLPWILPAFGEMLRGDIEGAGQVTYDYARQSIASGIGTVLHKG